MSKITNDALTRSGSGCFIAPVVSASLPPQFGTLSLLPFVIPLQRTLSVAFLRLATSSRPSAPPSGSPKCLGFGHWLTLCTINIYLLTYLLTSCTHMATVGVKGLNRNVPTHLGIRSTSADYCSFLSQP